MSETRKIAAILVADVVGYSRLAGADEDRTLARLRALRSDLIDPDHRRASRARRQAHRRRSLVEFRSVVDAVRCAIEVQNGMVERNAGLPPERRIEFRIGIHLGDVVEESDGDLMGDGVNIAARLEGIAKPGAICLSEDAYRQVKARLDLAVSDLGATQAQEHRRADPGLFAGGRRPALRRSPRRQRAREPEKPSARLALPDKPSIAVLPFQNMSGDPEQEYFADGMVEDIITGLSRFQRLFVIARNSSFTYKDEPWTSSRLGASSACATCSKGASARLPTGCASLGSCRSGDGAHLWADRFDGALEDVFDLQDQMTTSVVGAIAPKLEQVEIERAKRKPTESLDAYDYFLRALATSTKEPKRLSARHKAIL